MPPAYENLRERQMSKKRQFASALDSLAKEARLPSIALAKEGGSPAHWTYDQCSQPQSEPHRSTKVKQNNKAKYSRSKPPILATIHSERPVMTSNEQNQPINEPTVPPAPPANPQLTPAENQASSAASIPNCALSGTPSTRNSGPSRSPLLSRPPIPRQRPPTLECPVTAFRTVWKNFEKFRKIWENLDPAFREIWLSFEQFRRISRISKNLPNSGVFSKSTRKATKMPECRVMLRPPTSRSAWSAVPRKLSGLPLSNAKGAQNHRPAGSHSDRRTFSLSSSGREGRGEEALSSFSESWTAGAARERSRSRTFRISSLVIPSDLVIRRLLAKAFGVRHSVPSHHTYRSHLVTLSNTY